MSKRRSLPPCECSDPGCPVHRGRSCSRNATWNLRRVDMEDRSGTNFCLECSEDAHSSGLFDGGRPARRR